ncbi:hypothetical protein DSO57_1024161 [Entomophthora muscae]|uniref:Uncharacterized protein n=1 Tax=Entomophthora muscae TaxID=34485 RepID=A0ACC2UN87_9FUNG|nr:hypothetical protein DSO57_1024161 [Entomophthora muscae]
MNVDKSKLKPEKVGPAIILKLNKNNTYLLKGLRKPKQDKTLHHDCLRPCKTRQKQQETALPATEQQLVQYGAQAPDELPNDLPPEEANLQLGGVKTAGSTCQQGSEQAAQLQHPQVLLSGNGTNFNAKLVTSVVKALGSHLSFSAPYNPSINEEVERTNLTLVSKMRKLTCSNAAN